MAKKRVFTSYKYQNFSNTSKYNIFVTVMKDQSGNFKHNA